MNTAHTSSEATIQVQEITKNPFLLFSKGSDTSMPKSTSNQVLEQANADFRWLAYSQPFEINLDIPSYIEQVTAVIGILTAFDEDFNEEIEEFSNWLNKAYWLKQREHVAKGIIAHATNNTQSGIVKAE